MKNFNDLFKDFVFLALFIFAILGLFLTVQSQNVNPQPLADNPIINSTYNNLQNNFASNENSSGSVYGVFSAEKPAPGFFTIVLLTIVSVGKTFGTFIFGFYNIIIVIPAVYLGLSPVVFSGIILILTLAVIIGLWAVYKVGG